ncbi:hypothetical protein U9R90_00385 [Streptomyces sp. E11-3]|uniref:hypothetical protein n=1 Tax=Streptomyces sp. E11-3 TaxID=3110112 RepID=UPI00397FA081
MNLDPTLTRRRLDAALDHVAVTFRGMTARAQEVQCDCHWGSAEELALLKVPDVELEPDLLRRTWDAGDWGDHGAVLRRILPQFTRALVGGLVEPLFDMGMVGLSFARGHWQQWPARQNAAVRAFLHAWWAHSLAEADPAVSAYEVFAMCAEASGVLGPWLTAWETQDHPISDRHLARAISEWAGDLLRDELPWAAWYWDDDEARSAELAAWLVSHAPARLRALDVPEELLHQVRLMELTGAARWDNPH